MTGYGSRPCHSLPGSLPPWVIASLGYWTMPWAIAFWAAGSNGNVATCRCSAGLRASLEASWVTGLRGYHGAVWWWPLLLLACRQFAARTRLRHRCEIRGAQARCQLPPTGQGSSCRFKSRRSEGRPGESAPRRSDRGAIQREVEKEQESEARSSKAGRVWIEPIPSVPEKSGPITAPEKGCRLTGEAFLLLPLLSIASNWLQGNSTLPANRAQISRPQRAPSTQVINKQ